MSASQCRQEYSEESLVVLGRSNIGCVVSSDLCTESLAVNAGSSESEMASFK